MGSGALVINTSPTDTVAEITLLDTKKGPHSMLEEHDEFGMTYIEEGVESVPIGPAREVPTKVTPEMRKQAPPSRSIPTTEAALRVPAINATKVLDVRDYQTKFDPKAHPVAGGTVTVSNAHQWNLVYFDDFETNADGWFLSTNATASKTQVNDRRNACNNNTDHHLGGYCEFSKEEVTKTFINLPPHSALKITARYHFIDYWTGEYAYAKLNGKPVWMQSHAFCKLAFTEDCRGVDACGDNKFPDRLSHHIEIIVPHTEDKVSLTFGSSLETPACKASWAIDDVAVYIKF